MFAGEIAEELDVSPQLVGTRGKRLAEHELVTRETVKSRRQFKVTDRARNIYFSDSDAGSLRVDEEDPEY
jgi:Mn-dependent DtxR family transcriptional regulator